MNKNKVKIHVKIHANAKKNAIVNVKDDLIRISIKSRPVNNEANKELLEFLSTILKLSKKNISITKGLTSKFKTVSIDNYNEEELYITIKKMVNLYALFFILQLL
ncbi:MAG: DUF167 domain-containing protein [Solitalea-like symbiont of Tyrophagus putrescentiae]